MKIIYLHQYFNSPEMPGSTRSYYLARSLVKAGHSVELITTWREEPKHPDQAWFTTNEDGIQVHWMQVRYTNELSYLHRLGAFFRFAFGAARKASQLEGDLVFATSTPLTIALPAVYASKRLGIPLVFEVRDLWPEIPIALGVLNNPVLIALARWLERFAYQNSTRIIALSPGMRSGIIQTGFPEEKVHTIPNIADLESFTVPDQEGIEFRERYSWLRDRPLVVYTGTIGYVNGMEYMVHLANEVARIDPEICFLIAGSGREQDQVRSTAVELGLYGRNFFMIEPLPKQHIPGLLSAADFASSFVIDQPVLWDNSANKFFDSLAAGKPIIINYQGWQADLIREKEIGLVLDPLDITAASQRLVNKIRDRSWMEQAGRTARALARSEYSLGVLAPRFEQVLGAAAGAADEE